MSSSFQENAGDVLVEASVLLYPRTWQLVGLGLFLSQLPESTP
jgi:hypothetical protein